MDVSAAQGQEQGVEGEALRNDAARVKVRQPLYEVQVRRIHAARNAP